MINPINWQKNSITFWYPLLKRMQCIPVPKTIIIHTECKLPSLLDGISPEGINDFSHDLFVAIERIGTPCFLRSGLLSNKHDWVDSCYVTDPKKALSHVVSIVEMSAMANFFGPAFPVDFWAVRELIPTRPLFYAFNGMPITREIRVFIKDGDVQCMHPYWPADAFECFGDTVHENYMDELSRMDDTKNIIKLAKNIARFFPDYWSVDFLLDSQNKWWVTDMALGEESFHYPDCKYRGNKQ